MKKEGGNAAAGRLGTRQLRQYLTWVKYIIDGLPYTKDNRKRALKGGKPAPGIQSRGRLEDAAGNYQTDCEGGLA